MKIKLEYIKPYSFAHTFRRVQYYDTSSYLYRGGSFLRTIHGKKGPLILSISHNDINECVEVRVEGNYSHKEMESLKSQISRMLSTNVDLMPFYHHVKNDIEINRLIDDRIGMHFVLEPTMYECLMKTIISQQLNLTFAATLLNRFIAIAGKEIIYSNDKLHVFPTPEQVAGLSYDDLRQLQFSQRKAEYLIDISRSVVEGNLDLESLYNLSNQEIFEKLLSLRGVGKWTIECLLLFGLGRPDLLPASDIGLRNAIKKLYHLPEQPSEEAVRKYKEKWSPYSSYVTFYLWDSLS